VPPPKNDQHSKPTDTKTQLNQENRLLQSVSVKTWIDERVDRDVQDDADQRASYENQTSAPTTLSRQTLTPGPAMPLVQLADLRWQERGSNDHLREAGCYRNEDDKRRN
jgi:hypothetical protein